MTIHQDAHAPSPNGSSPDEGDVRPDPDDERETQLMVPHEGEGSAQPGAAGSARHATSSGRPGLYLSGVRRYWVLVVSGLLVGLALGSLAVNSMTPQYRSTAQVFISFQTADVSPEGMLQGLSFTQQQVSSYADIVTSPLVLEPVIDSLGLEEEPEELAQRVEATGRTDTVLIDISVTDVRPVMAQRIADEIAASLGEAIKKLERPVGTTQPPVAITIVRPGLLPEDASGPNLLFIIAVGGALGLSAGVGLSVFAQSQRRADTPRPS